jgi:hypothetical protein
MIRSFWHGSVELAGNFDAESNQMEFSCFDGMQKLIGKADTLCPFFAGGTSHLSSLL